MVLSFSNCVGGEGVLEDGILFVGLLGLLNRFELDILFVDDCNQIIDTGNSILADAFFNFDGTDEIGEGPNGFGKMFFQGILGFNQVCHG